MLQERNLGETITTVGAVAGANYAALDGYMKSASVVARLLYRAGRWHEAAILTDRHIGSYSPEEFLQQLSLEAGGWTPQTEGSADGLLSLVRTRATIAAKSGADGPEIERMLRAAELVRDPIVRVELYAFAAILRGVEDPCLPPSGTDGSLVDLAAAQVPVERWRREFQILKWAILTGNKTRGALLPIYVQCSERVPRDPDAALAVCKIFQSISGPNNSDPDLDDALARIRTGSFTRASFDVIDRLWRRNRARLARLAREPRLLADFLRLVAFEHSDWRTPVENALLVALDHDRDGYLWWTLKGALEDDGSSNVSQPGAADHDILREFVESGDFLDVAKILSEIPSGVAAANPPSIETAVAAARQYPNDVFQLSARLLDWHRALLDRVAKTTFPFAALSQENISATTATGATLVAGGATFRVWAPRATAVYLNGSFAGTVYDQQTEDRRLIRDAVGYWSGFQPGAQNGDQYRFWVVGSGSSGYKRDPYARELGKREDFPNCFSILRASDGYPWHDDSFRTPEFSDMVIYQAHIGTYAIRRAGVASNFLDVASKVPHLAALGINLLQLLPIDEQEANPSIGYGGTDLFSPDFPYIACAADLPDYLAMINDLLATRQLVSLELQDIESGPDQLKALVDLCHVYGIAVAFDVIYNHAGGFTVNGQLDDNCIYYFDRLSDNNNNNDSLYFTDQDRGTGGLAFAMWNQEVCRFLLDNGRQYIEEFHADGLRYDEVSILLSTNQESGWEFCRAMTTQLRTLQPRVLQNAEFWSGEFSDTPSTVLPIIAPASEGGAGFDVVQHDALRNALRNAIGTASAGAHAPVSVSAIASALYPPALDHAWRAVTCIENHDLVLAGGSPRIPALADPSNHRSWYARSRSRLAVAILLTAPGIPQLFMGQEFLEDKPWDSNPNGPDLLWWDGLDSDIDPAMTDHLRCTRDLIRLRNSQPALRGDKVRSYYVSDPDRVLAFHRWLEGIGRDVIVVASLAESTWWSYNLGFPAEGFWQEIFNSDVYNNWVNPWVAGNGTGVQANGTPMHGFATSATVVIPANGVVVFARG